jgi:hypothetical protein
LWHKADMLNALTNARFWGKADIDRVRDRRLWYAQTGIDSSAIHSSGEGNHTARASAPSSRTAMPVAMARPLVADLQTAATIGSSQGHVPKRAATLLARASILFAGAAPISRNLRPPAVQ